MRVRLKTKAEPKDGEVKRNMKFLLLPRRIDDSWVWLETVRVEKRYIAFWFNGTGDTGGDYWVTTYHLL